MIKRLFILFFLWSSITLQAQVAPLWLNNGVSNSRTTSAALWSDDFSDTSNWVITNDINTIGEWTFDTIIPSNLLQFMPSRLNAISADFGHGTFAIVNSDFYKYGVQQNSNLTVKNAIDLSGKPDVRLVFNQYYKASYDITTVYVSNDFNTWVPFYINGNYSPGFITPNPHRVSIDISSVAGNQSNVWIRFNYQGSWDYAWLIDDLIIEEIPEVDVETFDTYFYNYSNGMASCNMIYDNLTIGIRNIGKTDIMNINGDASFVVNNGIPVTEVAHLEDAHGNPVHHLNVGDSAYYVFVAPLSSSVVGINNIRGFIKITGDNYSENDSCATVSVKKYDSYDATANDYTMGFENGENFEGWVKKDIDGNDFSWEIASVGGRAGSSRCLRMVNNPSGDQNGNTGIADDWAISSCIDLQLNHQYEVSYYARLTSGYASNLEVKYGSSQTVSLLNKTVTTQFSLPDNSQYTLYKDTITIPSTDTYYIGFHAINKDSASGVALRIDDIKIKDVTGAVTAISKLTNNELVVYPNPANGTFIINGLSMMNSSLIKIKDVLGKELQAIESIGKDQLKVDVVNFVPGIYYVSIMDNHLSNITTKKILIQ